MQRDEVRGLSDEMKVRKFIEECGGHTLEVGEDKNWKNDSCSNFMKNQVLWVAWAR